MTLFGKDFMTITNDDTLSALEKKTTRLYSKMMTWVSAFPGNKNATAWKEAQLNLKKR